MPKKNTTKKKIQNNFKKSFKEHLWLWVLLGTFLIIGTLLAKYWFNHQINPDATSYFSIAEKYAHGNFKQAINGYWGPLLSWSLVPFVWIGKELIIGAKLINLFAGTLILITAYFLMLCEFNIDKKLTNLVTLILAFTVLGWNYPGAITPDILFVAVLIIEIYALILFLKKPSLKNILVLGFCGALLYYAKFFGGYFFIGQIGLLAVIDLFKSRKMSALVPYMKVFILFGLLILPFVVSISLKYNQPTLSTAGPYNQGIINVSGANVSITHPMTITGPYNPPNKTAYSIWEDPVNISVPHYHPFKNKADFTRLLQIIRFNAKATRNHIISMGFLTITGLLLLIAQTIYRDKKQFKNFLNPNTVLLTTSLVLAGGYILVLVEQRYLWGLVIIGLIALASFLNDGVKNVKISYLFMALSIVLIGWITIENIINNKYINKPDYTTGQFVSSIIPEGEYVISDTFNSIYTCYFAKLRCYGVLIAKAALADQENTYQQLKANKINYLIDNHSKDSDPNFIKFKNAYFTPISNTPGQPTIYKLR